MREVTGFGCSLLINRLLLLVDLLGYLLIDVITVQKKKKTRMSKSQGWLLLMCLFVWFSVAGAWYGLKMQAIDVRVEVSISNCIYHVMVVVRLTINPGIS